ncbi:Protein YceI [Burkholderiales bacterium]|nr:Protein YceI [Burkholderiales bacterium]
MKVELGLIGLLVSLAVAPAHAQQKLVSEKSEIRFVAKQMNVPTEGRFRKFSADILFDPAKPETAKAQIEVDLGSIDMGSEEGETEVKRKPWFNVEFFPKASFTGAVAKPLGGGRFEMPGKLGIKGISRDVMLAFALRQEGGNLIAEGSYPLKRLDFKIGEGAWADTDTVANEVQVRFRVVLSGAPAKR